MGEAAPYILLADDDQELRTTLEKFSLKAGWQFDSVPDCGSMLSAAGKKVYDVVITDYVMGGAGGIELLRKLREQRPAQAVIVVARTNSVDDAVSALREGVSDYLLRPLDFDAFKKAVERVLKGTRHQGVQDGGLSFVELQSTAYRFSSGALADGFPPLPIVVQLHRGGLITLEQRLKLDLAYQEALANGLEHGNLELESAWKEEFDASGIDRFSREKALRLADPHFSERQLRVRSCYRRGKLTIVVQDDGSGFLPNDLARRELPHEILCHGRGVAIITAVMDEVIYSRRGTRVKMVKHL